MDADWEPSTLQERLPKDTEMHNQPDELSEIDPNDGACTPGGFICSVNAMPMAGPAHIHNFVTWNALQLSSNANNVPIDPEDKENVRPLPKRTFRCFCTECLLELKLTWDDGDDRSCRAEGYQTHHYHPLSKMAMRCCGCALSFSFTTTPPVLPLNIVPLLLKNRSFDSDNSLTTNPEPQPTVISAVILMSHYVYDLVQGNRRPINTLNRHFQERIGLDNESIQIMEAIGYTHTDGVFYPPPDTPDANEKVQRVNRELIVAINVLGQQSNKDIVGPLQSSRDFPRIKSANVELRSVLGLNMTLERDIPGDGVAKQGHCLKFGAAETASDSLIVWLSRLLFLENPDKSMHYMDVLTDIAGQRQSNILDTEVATERSNGRLGNREVQDAYRYLGFADADMANQVDDQVLLDQFKDKVASDITQEAMHRAKLRVIAEARNSESLRRYLDFGHESTERDDRPVGLVNIGNTCYLNSVLQYYFTLLPFRQAVLEKEEFTGDDVPENLTPQTSGGIEVNRRSVIRARRFTSLLRQLFVDLKDSNQRALSPAFELASMALLDGQAEEAEDEEQGEEMEQVPENPVATEDKPVSEVQSVDVFSDISQPTLTKDTTQTNSTVTSSTAYDSLATPAPLDTKDLPTPIDASVELAKQEEAQLSQQDTSSDMTELPSYEDAIAMSGPPVISEEKKQVIHAPPLPPRSAPAVTQKTSKTSNLSLSFGSQQDVTECMSNIMDLVETALKSAETSDGEKTTNIIRDMFYGKLRRILTYKALETSAIVRKEQEEDFLHLIVDGSQDKDLYDGLDKYFFKNNVEHFRGGWEPVEETTVKRLPPVLQIQVQRVQFDKSHGVYKSNAFVQFDKVVYMDRYCEENFADFASRRAQAAEWRKEINDYQKTIKYYMENEAYRLPVPDLLEASIKILKENAEAAGDDIESIGQAIQILKDEADRARHTVEASTERVNELRSKIRHQYDDAKEYAYNLHAVFIHQGQANYGHYWIYIYDGPGQQWWKYNDSNVSKVEESEIFQDTTGSMANPYFLVYVKDGSDDLVNTIAKRQPSTDSA